MADDPRQRRTPPYGNRALTERGRDSGSERDRLVNKHDRQRSPIPAYVEEEHTPVTMITMVRAELKDDIAAVDEKVEKVSNRVEAFDTSLNSAMRSVERLTGEVATTNKLIPEMLTTLKDELRAKRTVDEHATLTRLEVTKHREITAIDEGAAKGKVKRKLVLQVAGALTSASVVGAVVTLLATGHC